MEWGPNHRAWGSRLLASHIFSYLMRSNASCIAFTNRDTACCEKRFQASISSADLRLPASHNCEHCKSSKGLRSTVNFGSTWDADLGSILRQPVWRLTGIFRLYPLLFQESGELQCSLGTPLALHHILIPWCPHAARWSKPGGWKLCSHSLEKALLVSCKCS